MKASAAVLNLWQEALELLKQTDLESSIETLLDLQSRLKETMQNEVVQNGHIASLRNLTEYSRSIQFIKRTEIKQFLKQHPENEYLLDNLFFSLLGQANTETSSAVSEASIRAFHFHASEIVLRLSSTCNKPRANAPIIDFRNTLSKTAHLIELIAAKSESSLNDIKTFNDHMSVLRNANDGTLNIPDISWSGWEQINSAIVENWRLATSTEHLKLHDTDLSSVCGRPNWSRVEVSDTTIFDDPEKRMAEIIIDNIKQGETIDTLNYYARQTQMKERKLITSKFVLNCLKEIRRTPHELHIKKQLAVQIFQYFLPKIKDTNNIVKIAKALIGLNSMDTNPEQIQNSKFIREESPYSIYSILKKTFLFLCCYWINPHEGNTQTWSIILDLIKNRLTELNQETTLAELKQKPDYRAYYDIMKTHRGRGIHLFSTRRGAELPQPPRAPSKGAHLFSARRNPSSRLPQAHCSARTAPGMHSVL